jgi:hypothetical protein
MTCEFYCFSKGTDSTCVAGSSSSIRRQGHMLNTKYGRAVLLIAWTVRCGGAYGPRGNKFS